MGLIKGLWDLLTSPKAESKPAIQDGRPHPLDRIVVPQARDRWLSTSVRSYTPESIETTLRGAFGGNLLAQWQLFDLMEETWPHLAKNLNEIKRAVRSMDLTVDPFRGEAQEPDAESKEKAALVRRGLANMRWNPARDENDERLTRYDIMDAWGKGLSVLEIDWEQVGGEVLPKSTRWIHPRYYGYSSFSADLLLNVTQINTRLDPIIENMSTSGPVAPVLSLQPQIGGMYAPFPENKFLISVQKNKSGHTIGGALLRELAGWWCMSNFATEWMLNFAQIFGQPFRWAEYDPTRPGLLQQVSDMLENMGSAGWGAFPLGTKLEFKEAMKSGSNNPQDVLLRFADKICDIVILGQTLSTDVGDSGGGSRALGQVHDGVRSEIIEAAGDFVALVETGQLAPAILELNYGNRNKCPRVIIASKEIKDAMGMIQRDKIALSIPGVKASKQWFYERHDIPEPDQGDTDTIGGMPAGPDGGMPGDEPPVPAGATNAKDASEQLADNVLEDLTGVQAKWLGGVKPHFMRLAALAQSGKVSDAEFVHALEKSAKEMPELFSRLDTEALQTAMTHAMSTALVNGVAKGVMHRGPGSVRRKR